MLALDSASGRSEPTAWTHVELGKLAFGERATSSMPGGTSALRWRRSPAIPTHSRRSPGVAAAQGDLQLAAALARRSADAVPLVQFVGTLGDVERGARRRGSGERAVRTRRRDRAPAARERRPHGSRARAVRPRPRPASPRGARAGAVVRNVHGRASRPTMSLAWALYRNGRCAEASRYSKRALATRHARRDQVRFHRGMIERCLGHGLDAKRWFAQRSRAQPALLADLGAGRAKVRGVKRLLILVAVCSRSRLPLRRSRIRWAISRSTATAASSSPATASMCTTCSTSPRSRRIQEGARDPEARLRDRGRRAVFASRSTGGRVDLPCCSTRRPSTRPGAAGLETLRFEAVYDGGAARGGGSTLVGRGTSRPGVAGGRSSCAPATARGSTRRLRLPRVEATR